MLSPSTTKMNRIAQDLPVIYVGLQESHIKGEYFDQGDEACQVPNRDFHPHPPKKYYQRLTH